LEERREPLDLPDLVVIRQDGEDRLVEAAGQQLDLAARGEASEQIEGPRRPLTQPLEQAPGAVHAQTNLRARVEPLEERTVRALRRFDEDVIEVADRLV